MKMRTIVLGIGLTASLQASPPPRFRDADVSATAKAALAGYLEQIPVGQESQYGFENRREFLRADLGSPLAVYGIRASVSDSLPAIDSLWNQPMELHMWRVPVTVDGKPRAFVTVESKDSVLSAGDFGASSLAQEIGALEDIGPTRRRAILRLEGLRCDVLVVGRIGKGLGEADYHPLRSARAVFGADTASFRSRKNLFQSIHRMMRRNLSVRP